MKKKSRRLGRPALSSELTRRFLERIAEMAGCPEQVKLVELWRNWPVVMGEDIAGLGLPLGQRDGRLEVGCEDSMAAQELRYLREDILSRANAFMETAFFKEIKVLVVTDKKPLWQERPETRSSSAPKAQPTVRSATGVWLGQMDPKSPIARCYKAYCLREDT